MEALKMNVIDEFDIDCIKKDSDQVIFFMEDTFNFEVWLLDFEMNYTMKHFVDGSLNQVIISREDYKKIDKYVYDDAKKAEILKTILEDIFGVEGGFIDELASQNTDIVFVGQLKDPAQYTIGDYHGEVVSIESDGLLKIFNAINVVLQQ